LPVGLKNSTFLRNFGQLISTQNIFQMKLIRFGQPGQEKHGLLHNNQIFDASNFVADYTEDFFTDNGLEKLKAAEAQILAQEPVAYDSVRIAAPIVKPSKIICIGLNYADHARESGMAIPTEPIVFFKATTALCGPNDDTIIPKNSVKTDWEVEYIDEADALDHVAGYALMNDLSEREFQLERGGQWVKGKSADTFAPLGPFLATQDEIADVNNLKMWLTVNGKTMQNSDTSNLIFKVPQIVSYLSQFMTLLPGDVISTGTPPGVGLGFKPPIYLQPGDVVELGIEGLGQSKQQVKAYGV
jgi:2,4-didehydro-3-deoxy-L-rhamnonate hydrolase